MTRGRQNATKRSVPEMYKRALYSVIMIGNEWS